MSIRSSLFAATALALLAAGGARAQSGELVLYCSVEENWCRVMSEASRARPASAC